MAVVLRIELVEAMVARGRLVKITVAGILKQDPDTLTRVVVVEADF